MVDGLVFFVVEKLSSLITEEVTLLYGVREEMEWLLSEMRWMASFLKDAEDKLRNKKGSELIKNWVREVRELAQQAEDIIDIFVAEMEPQPRQRRSGRGLRSRSMEYACFPFQLKPRHKVGAKIRSLKAKIKQIEASRLSYGLVNLDIGQSSTSADATSSTNEALQARRRIPPNYLGGDDVNAMVGFDAHKVKIIGMLLDANNMPQRSVVSIVGIGGIGKTTLATNIYRSTDIKVSFHACACISVSQNYQPIEMLRKISTQLMKHYANEPQHISEIDGLKEKIYMFLKEKRYLIVLDDVWSTDVWELLAREVLPDPKNGSRVLLTTRSMEVATSADHNGSYQLPFLTFQQSWKLFLSKAFPENRDGEGLISCPEELVDVGCELVNKCGGLPLALVVLGGLVSKKRPNRGEWRIVADRMVDWDSTKDGQACLDILALSYDDLPHHHLKSCFLYLAVYPENWYIESCDVVGIWIAEGFVPHKDTGYAYLEELAERSMIHVISREYPEKTFAFQIHDLFHDFCIREARDDGFLNVYCLNKSRGKIKHDGISFCRVAFHTVSTQDVKEWWPSSNLRSIISFGVELDGSQIFNGMKLMRVLYLNNLKGLARFPIERMECTTHLRLLDLTGCSSLTELPSSIGSLSNVQTIRLNGTGIKKLPDSVGKLQKLKMLFVPNHCECPPSVGNLTDLEVLGSPSARGGWIEHGLEKLVNIQVLAVYGPLATQIGGAFLGSVEKMKTLFFMGLIRAEVISTELLVVLSNMNQLRHLWLDGPMICSTIGQLIFPPSIAFLHLEGSRLGYHHMPLLGKLPNLRILTLEQGSYAEKEMVCTAGDFPNLEVLRLCNLDGLEDSMIQDGSMPNLRDLLIFNCTRLRMLPDGLQHVTSLRILGVGDERKEFRERLQQKVGEDWHKIRHVQEIRVVDGLIFPKWIYFPLRGLVLATAY